MTGTHSEDIEDLDFLSHAMDNHFRGPFGWRFGWDGVIGLVPVVGDVVTNSVSGYIIFRAAQLGCPLSVLLRMLLNVAVENVVDLIPFFGNLFDFVWKSNSRNLRLVRSYLHSPKRVRRGSIMVLALIAFTVAATIGASVVLTIYILQLVLSALGQMI